MAMEKVGLAYTVVTIDGEYLGLVDEVGEGGFWIRAIGRGRVWMAQSCIFGIDYDYDSVTLVFTEDELNTHDLEYLTGLAPTAT
jgi:hypothetical protein